MEKLKLIQGNKERAEEVRKTLEGWGANLSGDITIFRDKTLYFYIDNLGIARIVSDSNVQGFLNEGKVEIYELPTPVPKCKSELFGKSLNGKTEKVKLIQGNKERAKEIRKTLEVWGGVNENNLSFEYEDTYYYLDQFGFCKCTTEENAKELVAEGKAEIYELPLPKSKCALKPFDKVLVRNNSQSEWDGDLFTHMDKDGLWHICLTGYWLYCIPYEGNEYLLGTSKEPERCD